MVSIKPTGKETKGDAIIKFKFITFVKLLVIQLKKYSAIR